MLRSLAVLFLAVSAAAQNTTFHDARTGVSFRYPAAWQLGGLDDFMKPSVLREGAKQVVAVGVRGLPGTTATGIVFTFATAPAPTEDACRAMAVVPGFSGLLGDRARWITVGDRRLWRVHGADAREGHSADQVVYAAFQPLEKSGRCLLFEEDIDMAAAYSGNKTLAPPPQKQMIALVTALENIIATVQLPPGVSVAPAQP